MDNLNAVLHHNVQRKIACLLDLKKKCVESCFTETKYKYQYNGECLEKCLEDTFTDESAHLCRVKNYESCTKSTSEFELYNFLKEGGVEKIAKTYQESSIIPKSIFPCLQMKFILLYYIKIENV